MISIIVPVYNAAPYLERCIKSILGQSYKDLELILVDDGSTDESGEICAGFAENDIRVRYVRKENGGVSTARNTGLSMAKGEYVAMFDSDDEVDEHMIEKMFSRLISEEGCQLVVCSVREHKGGQVNDILPEKTGFFHKDRLALTHPHLLKNSLINSCANKLYVKKYINKRFDESLCLGEDLVFNLSYIDNIDGIYFMDEPLYHYMIRDDSLNQTYRSDMVLQMEKLYLKKMEFARKWNFGRPTVQDIATTYITFVIYSLSSMYKYSGISSRQCFRVLRTVLKKETVAQAARQGKPEKRYQSIIYPFLKIKIFWILHMLFVVRSKM